MRRALVSVHAAVRGEPLVTVGTRNWLPFGGEGASVSEKSVKKLN